MIELFQGFYDLLEKDQQRVGDEYRKTRRILGAFH
jgi:hypothetical protein